VRILINSRSCSARAAYICNWKLQASGIEQTLIFNRLSSINEAMKETLRLSLSSLCEGNTSLKKPCTSCKSKQTKVSKLKEVYTLKCASCAHEEVLLSAAN